MLASVSKLFTHAILFQLIDESQLDYSLKVLDILEPDLVKSLPNIEQITLRHLVDQISGLPDYETGRPAVGDRLIKQILRRDRAIDHQTILSQSAKFKAAFAPGKSSRAHYSNLNAYLLGLIIETTSRQQFCQVLNAKITGPLGLKNTGCLDPKTSHPPVLNGRQGLTRPNYIASLPASSGLVSTTQDLMKFFRAFMDGQLFNKKHISNPEFRPLQWFPARYGSGLLRLALPRIMSPLAPAPEIIGHSGFTGSFAFYCPSRSVFLVGTINQVKFRPFTYIYRYLDKI